MTKQLIRTRRVMHRLHCVYVFFVDLFPYHSVWQRPPSLPAFRVIPVNDNGNGNHLYWKQFHETKLHKVRYLTIVITVLLRDAMKKTHSSQKLNSGSSRIVEDELTENVCDYIRNGLLMMSLTPPNFGLQMVFEWDHRTRRSHRRHPPTSIDTRNARWWPPERVCMAKWIRSRAVSLYCMHHELNGPGFKSRGR